MVNSNSRRLGDFSISSALVKDSVQLDRVFSFLGFVPVEVKYNWANDSIDYRGTSPCFSEVPEGSAVPVYGFLLESNEEGVVTGISLNG